MEINCANIETMTKVVSCLVREGLMFEVREVNYGWIIKLTGGY